MSAMDFFSSKGDAVERVIYRRPAVAESGAERNNLGPIPAVSASDRTGGLRWTVRMHEYQP